MAACHFCKLDSLHWSALICRARLTVIQPRNLSPKTLWMEPILSSLLDFPMRLLRRTMVVGVSWSLVRVVGCLHWLAPTSCSTWQVGKRAEVSFWYWAWTQVLGVDRRADQAIWIEYCVRSGNGFCYVTVRTPSQVHTVHREKAVRYHNSNKGSLENIYSMSFMS